MTSLSETSILSGSSGVTSGYQIDQSIRFNDDESAYMHRTPSSGGNRDKWTWSAWVKRGDFLRGATANHTMFSAGADSDTNNYSQILINGSSGGVTGTTFKFNSYTSGSAVANFATNATFNDVAAWYHFVVVYDSGNAVETNRVQMYVNGVRITSFGTQSYPSLNADSYVNHTVKHSIGRRNLDSSRYWDGYMTEIYLLDGYAYGPSYFGEFKEDTGIWIPKAYEGSYGTNGFHIDGRDSSDLGDDESGQGNDYATSGLATHDQMADTPTNNFAVWNLNDSHSTPNWTASNGNLDLSWNGANYTNHLFSTLSMPSSGKWYFEIEVDSDSSQIIYYASMRIGIMRDDFNAVMVEREYSGVNLTDASTDPEILVQIHSNARVDGLGTGIANALSAMQAGDVLNFARSGAKLWIGKNGTYYNSGDPGADSNPTLSALPLQGFRANIHWTSTSASHGTMVLKTFFGADKSIGSGTGFNNTVPTGFKALNSFNLGDN